MKGRSPLRCSHLTIGCLAVAVLAACASASVEDVPGGGGQFSRILISPASANLGSGDSQQFLADCLDANGVHVQCPNMTWTVTGGNRTSTSTGNDTVGVYTAGGTAGSYRLQATAGGKSGVAAVNVLTGGAAGNITINTSQTFQTIQGWEAALSSGWSVASTAYPHLADSAVYDLGLTRIRLEATGNAIESVSQQSGACGLTTSYIGQNDNNDPNVVNAAGFSWYCFDQKVTTFVLPIKQRVEARGERFTLNLCYVGFRPSADFQQSDPAEYAEFVLVVLNHLKSVFGLEPDVWEVRLEPDTGPTVITGTTVGQLLVAAATRARAAGFNKVMFAAPSNASASGALNAFHQVLAVPGAAPYLTELVYHRYSGVNNSVLNSIRTEAQTAGVESAMLEYLKADEHTLWQDLTLAGVSWWSKFALAGPFPSATSGNQLYYADLATNQFRLRPATYYLRQYFKYVRPGYVRVGATTTLAGTEPVAFRAPGGRVVVVVNTSGGQQLRIGGLPAGTYQISFSTPNALGALGQPVSISAGEVLVTSLPEAGTLTVSP